MVSRFAEDDISSNVRLLRSRLRKVARHARLSDSESDPDATAKAPDAAALPHRNLACMRGNSARAESRSAREGESGGLTPPPWVPRSRAETSAAQLHSSLGSVGMYSVN